MHNFYLDGILLSTGENKFYLQCDIYSPDLYL